MSGKGGWFAMSAQFTGDPKVQALGERFGPGGPLAAVVLLEQARLQAAGGSVERTYRDLAHGAFIDAGLAQEVIDAAIELELVVEEWRSPTAFKVSLPAWDRWQNAFRKARSRAGVTSGHEESRDVPLQDKTGTETTPEPSAQGSLPVQVPPELSLFVATLNRVVEGKGAKPLNVRAAIKACRDFDDRDQAAAIDRFAHYWLDGKGQNRKLADVAGAWRNWLRSDPPASAPSTRPGSGGRVAALVARAQEQAA